MTDKSAFGYQEDQPGVSPNPLGPQGPGQYKFSPDELRVLKECNVDSFYKRSLPIGTVLGLGTYYAMQQGRLKPNPRFGPFPKVTLAVVIGYFIGKLSYQQACAEKLMALPGSYIGQLLRDKRDGKISGGPVSGKGLMFGAKPDEIYSDAGQESSLDLDTDRPIFLGDEGYRPLDDGVKPTSQTEAAPARSYTYEELRQRNRSDHQNARQDPYRLEQAPPISRASDTPIGAPQPQGPTKINKYGDAME